MSIALAAGVDCLRISPDRQQRNRFGSSSEWANTVEAHKRACAIRMVRSTGGSTASRFGATVRAPDANQVRARVGVMHRFRHAEPFVKQS
ncbi:hypothetical protein [Burkholderia stagnalis]|uniref:hypothetical protein n=1 Tax=Burkholderia stagnalis TaxID=1503054 RepID=UPI000F583D99|nr:hypothetical protein [Burkholderia stagnalis]